MPPVVSLAVTLCPFLIVLAVAGGFYLQAWSGYSEEIERHRLEIERVGWIADNASHLSNALASADRSLAADRLLSHGDANRTAADLQNAVKTLLDGASLQISSIQPAAEGEEHGLNFVSVRAQAGGSYDKVIAFLRSTRNATPTLLIAAVDVMPDPTQQQSVRDTAGARYIVQFEAVRLIAGKP